MTIDTQKLRDGPYLRDGKETMRIMNEAADALDALAAEAAELTTLCQRQSDLLSQTAVAVRGPEPELTLYSHADIPSRVKAVVDDCDAQAAEIARLNAIQAWQPIETAPRDGTAILLGSSDGAWIAKYVPVYPSGYRPKSPWFSLMLNHDHMGRFPSAKPTHWMPLPAAPDALSGESND